MTVAIAIPTTEEVQTFTTDLVRQAQGLEVTDALGYELAAELVKGSKALQEQIRGEFADPKKKAHEAHRSICDLEKKLLTPLVNVESALKSRMLGWQRSERERQERANREREAELRRQEEERRLAEAVAAEEDGDAEEADAILDAEPAPIIVAPVAAQKVEGIKIQKRYRARVVDMGAFVKEIARRPDLLNLVTPNERALNELARALRDQMELPGVEVYVDETIAAGR